MKSVFFLLIILCLVNISIAKEVVKEKVKNLKKKFFEDEWRSKNLDNERLKNNYDKDVKNKKIKNVRRRDYKG